VQDLPRVDDRIPGDDLGALGEEAGGEDEARRLAQVVRVRLEGEAEQGDSLPAQRAEVPLHLRHRPPDLQLVHLDHRGDKVEVVARVPGEELQERHVLREARTAEADSGT
jgi:hypothetical protein